MDNAEKQALRTFLQDVSAAINEAGGTNGTIQASQMPTRIRSLSAGGGSSSNVALYTNEGGEAITVDGDTVTLMTRDTDQDIDGWKDFNNGIGINGDDLYIYNGITLSGTNRIHGEDGITFSTDSNNPIKLFPNDYSGTGKVFYKGQEIATKAEARIEIVDLTVVGN